MSGSFSSAMFDSPQPNGLGTLSAQFGSVLSGVGITPPATTAAELEALMATLPTTPPATPGILWNNGGEFAVS